MSKYEPFPLLISFKMKTRSRCANLMDDDRETETDESSLTISSSKRRKCISNKMVDHIQKYTRNGLPKIADLPHSIKRELETSRDTDQKSGISPHSNSNDTFANEDEKQNVRRSTRQRKFMYDNLNQTWLLAPSIPEFSSKFESLFARDPQNSSREDGPVRRSVRNRSYELRRLGLTAEGLEFEDMYSRVKRKRRKTVHSFYTRRISQDAGSMADTEDTDRRGLSDSDTIDDQSDLEGGNLSFFKFPAGIAVGESQEDTVVHGPSAVNGPKYSLRPKKPITKRFQFPIQPVRPRRSAGASIFEATHSRPRESFKSTAHRTHIFRRKRHAIHNSSSSSSSDDERRFEKRKAFSMARARNRCLPLNFVEEDLTKGALRDRIKIGSSLADIDPMAIDKTVTFEHIGGLDKHIQSLKEMVLFPLMYPEVFQRFNITPPRGVLFYGPPGTGKTLVARALANECCSGDKRVAFFMRKGADCLSKWVGESERQLRLLFDQAYTMRPAIIFFDEIDGLAPVRSTRQDQIHSSIVSTLLALMDGLDNRGEIVIIGATNRPDAIDPALRRPGRFDRELSFSLPSYQSREKILNILTGAWVPSLPRQLISELAARTAGYCGADLKALCSEAGLVALRRRYPQIYHSKQKLMLDVETIQVQPVDFLSALKKMKPSMHRTSVVSARPLPILLKPLLEAMLQNVLFKISKIFPVFSLVENGNSWPASVIDTNIEDNCVYHEALPRLNHVSKTKLPSEAASRLSGFSPLVHRPYFLLSGREGQGQGVLAPAVLYLLENVSIHRLDIPTLYAVTCRSAEESCAQIFHEAQRDLPSVIFLPHIGYWWETLSETVKATFLSLLQDLDPSTPLLLFATSDVSFGELPPRIQEIFGASADQVFCMRNPTHDERRSFFSNLVHEIYKLPQKAPVEKPAEEEILPVAPPLPVSRKLTAEELERLRQREEATLRELRVFLRDILTKLARDRRFSVFSRPVDPEEVPDYQEVIKNPMDLETMMTKIDRHRYETVAQFLSDIDLVCQNALEYNPDRDPSDKLIRHRACALKDAAHAIVLTELDDEFEKICQGIQAARKERGEVSSIALPERAVPVERTCAVPEEKRNEGKENGLPSPTRFSKRIRSMGGLDGQSPAKSFTSPKRTSRYMIWRRRKSPWFGSCRRKLIRRKIKCAGCPKKMKLQSGGAKFVKTSDPVQQESKVPEPSGVEDRKDASGTDSSATTVVSPALHSPEPHRGPGEHPTSPKKCQSSCDISKESNCSRNWNGGFSTRQMDSASADDQSCADLTSDVCSINIDPMSLDCLVSQIVRFTENYPVEKLQQLYSMLQQCVYRHRRRHDKKDLLKEMEQSLDSFLHYKPS
ncbi:LOW QUALITY PROTEIN: ATPase family AAA domain-containing protein 2-like [Uloborus diversus]|uniref:LOW QUALITY PROTEIN: ATPase family AAA domain-containing protein 2-like n=1 Tax=Uloborus diversus TaxID=327109 RepID=UPI00240A0BCB|nr:LOW QUALITY PROTEIN: ATPase family AAA domain-containing protein 2-like [Uloborus diversus]